MAFKIAGAALALSVFASGCAFFQAEDVRLAQAGAQALATGDYETAESRFAAALEINSANAPALLNLGVVYQNTGRAEEARNAYLAVIETERRERALETLEPAPRNAPAPDPAELARENLADLELLRADYADWYTGLPSPGEFSAGDLGRIQAGVGELVHALANMADHLDALYASLESPAESPVETAVALAAPEPFDGPAAAGVPAEALATREAALADGAPLDITDLQTGTGWPEPSASGAAMAEPGLAAEAPSQLAGLGGEGLNLKVHVASFRTEERAREGWEILSAEHGDLLGPYRLDLKEIDLGPGLGVFFRVRAVPLPSEAAALSLCDRLRARQLYCAVSYF